jgi:hypothetical protein
MEVMDKFWAFRQLLDFMADHSEVVDADMDNYRGDIVITGETDDQVITITVSMNKKEENNGN